MEVDESDDDLRFRFETFDFDNVVEHGIPLLASDGRDYNLQLHGLSAQERLQVQRKNLRRTLNIGGDLKTLISEEDLKEGEISAGSKRGCL